MITSGPYSRFLRRILVVASGAGMAVLAPQNWGPVLFRAPYTFGFFTMSYVVLSIAVMAAGVVALLAQLRERFVDGPPESTITQRLDMLWRGLTLTALILFLLILTTCLLTTRPFGTIRLSTSRISIRCSISR